MRFHLKYFGINAILVVLVTFPTGLDQEAPLSNDSINTVALLDVDF